MANLVNLLDLTLKLTPKCKINMRTWFAHDCSCDVPAVDVVAGIEFGVAWIIPHAQKCAQVRNTNALFRCKEYIQDYWDGKIWGYSSIYSRAKHHSFWFVAEYHNVTFFPGAPAAEIWLVVF